MAHKNPPKVSSKLLLLATVASVALSGCQSMPHQANNPQYYNNNNRGNYPQNVARQPQGQYDGQYNNPYGQGQPEQNPQYYQNISPAAGPLPMAQPPAYGAQPTNSGAEAALIGLKDRLERVEKAMLRLDKRMQLVEKNELNRINGAVSAPAYQFGQSQAAPQQFAAISPAGGPPQGSTPFTDEQIAMQSLNIGPAGIDNPAEGFRNVSTASDGTIRSALQAGTPHGEGRNLDGRQLASLADGNSARNSNSAQAATDVAVWTVKYESGKIWPDRTQLPASRDVVNALRNSKTVTLFARGTNPQDKNFRERVKALSRYLAKVSSQETVPIAAMPSPQLDTQTIEILATH